MYRVLHAPLEIAGQVGLFTRSLHDKGIPSVGYNYWQNYLSYQNGVIETDAYELHHLFEYALDYFDIFHFHYGYTLFEDCMDLPILRDRGKKIIMHHWGSDVRTLAIASMNNRYVVTDDSPTPDQVHSTLTKLSKFIDHAIVQDYEVYPYVASYYKYVHVLPVAIDVQSRTPRIPSALETDPLIIHAPTNPSFKGTEYIEKALNRLRRKGYRFRYKRIEKMSNTEAIHLYEQADVIVDQILCGSYGMLAVESMSLGKPVVGYIREDLHSRFTEVPPIFSADPNHIYDALKDLILYPNLRRELGKKGREYVEKYHALEVVMPQLIEIYNKMEAGL